MSNLALYRCCVAVFCGGLLLVVSELFGGGGEPGWIDEATQAAVDRVENAGADEVGDGELPQRIVAVGRSSERIGGSDADERIADAEKPIGRFSSDSELIDSAEGFDPSPVRDEPAPHTDRIEQPAGNVRSMVN